MKLTILQPGGKVFEREVSRVQAEAENGSFCLKPRHIDFLAALVPGILAYEENDGSGGERYVAVNEGILVKRSAEVFVATRDAVWGSDLETLTRTVEERFGTVHPSEQQARTAMARLERMQTTYALAMRWAELALLTNRSLGAVLRGEPQAGAENAREETS